MHYKLHKQNPKEKQRHYIHPLAMRLIQVLIILVFSLATFEGAVLASDPDIISDFIVPPNYNGTVDGTFFTFTGFRGIFNQAPQTIKAGKASSVEFPVLNGQSVSYAVLQFPPNSLLPPHTGPDATGLLFLLDGTLEVGLINTKNNLYTQKLQTGDLFVFPKGLVHYQYNSDPQLPATAIAAFGSASARAVTVLPSVFGTGINNMILAKSFKTDVGTIEKIKTGFTIPTSSYITKCDPA